MLDIFQKPHSRFRKQKRENEVRFTDDDIALLAESKEDTKPAETALNAVLHLYFTKTDIMQNIKSFTLKISRG